MNIREFKLLSFLVFILSFAIIAISCNNIIYCELSKCLAIFVFLLIYRELGFNGQRINLGK